MIKITAIQPRSKLTLPAQHPSLGLTIAILAIHAVLLAQTTQAQGLLDDITRWEDGRSMSASSVRLGLDNLPDPTANVDCNHVVEPGQTVVIADLTGPGVITHIWMTLYHFQSLQFGAEPGGRANPQEILIRMYWDDRPDPDVEVPMSDFFAAGFGKRTTVLSLPVVTEDGDSYNCWWRMPFRKSARIEVINQSDKNLRALFHSVDWIKKNSLPANTMYFCARYRQEYPVLGNPDQPDNEYLILDAEGTGYYVGTLLSVRTRSPDWFGEGDIRMTIDSEETPSVWGTGTEDYFLSAWGQKPCLTPYFGTAYLSHPNRDVGQMSSCYRWHIADPIVFNTSLKVAIETMGFANRDENPENLSRLYGQRQDDVSSVAYWYQLGPSKRYTQTTTAEQRKLPSIDPICAWGSDFQADQYHGQGRTRMRNTHTYFDTDPLLEFTPISRDNAWIELTFEVQRKQPYRLVVVLGRSPHSGIYQASLEGVKIGNPIDLYSDENEVDDFQLMDFWPEPGKYTFRLECVGRNHLSDNDLIHVNSVRLRERRPRVEQIGYLKDHNWREMPILIDKNTPQLKAN